MRNIKTATEMLCGLGRAVFNNFELPIAIMKSEDYFYFDTYLTNYTTQNKIISPPHQKLAHHLQCENCTMNFL